MVELGNNYWRVRHERLISRRSSIIHALQRLRDFHPAAPWAAVWRPD